MPLHSQLTGSELHENKGVFSASDDTVASAQSGSTVWKKVNSNMLDGSSIFDTNKQVLTTVLNDVSTAETIYLGFPFSCTINKIVCTLQGAITGADSTVTFKNHDGSSMGYILVEYSGSGPGDVFSLLPSSNNSFTDEERLLIQTDGASSTAQKLFITVEVQVTGQ